MSRIDGWTDARVDYVIHLLVECEKLIRHLSPELYEEVRRFLLEEA